MTDSIQTQAITVADVLALDAQGVRREVVNGEWVESDDDMAGELHGAIEANLIILLGMYVKQNQLGRVYPGDTTYVMEKTEVGVQTIRYPDVSFVSAARVKTQKREDVYHLAPDLAIEIIAPSERGIDIHAKLSDYFRCGVRQVWQVYPQQQEVIVYTGLDERKTHTLNDTINGGDVLPSLGLAVKQIFE